MINKQIHIYTLSDPRTGEVRYVGRTDRKPEIRFKEHIKRVKAGHLELYSQRWIKTLLDINLEPVFEVIEITGDILREKHWINHYRSISCRLTNLHEGGNPGGHNKGTKLSKEQVDYMRKIFSKKVYIWSIDRILLKVANSCKEASEYMSCKLNIISKYALGKLVYKNKFIFSYSDSFPEDTIMKIGTNKGMRVLCIDKITKEEIIYSNINEAAEKLGIYKGKLYNLAKDNCFPDNVAARRKAPYILKYIL